MSGLQRSITHSKCTDSGSVPLFLTNMQGPVVWLPWIPCQVFWVLLSTSVQHHGLMASGSICLSACMRVCVCVVHVHRCGSVCLCTQHIDAVCVTFSLSSSFLSFSSSQCHPLPSPLYPAFFFFISLYPLHSSSPLLPPEDSLSTRGQTWPAHFGPAAHLSVSVLCIQGERLMGPGDRERQGQRGRIREEDRGRGGVMLKGNIAVKVLH